MCRSKSLWERQCLEVDLRTRDEKSRLELCKVRELAPLVGKLLIPVPIRLRDRISRQIFVHLEEKIGPVSEGPLSSSLTC